MGGSRIYVGFIEEGFYVQSSTWGLAGFTWCLIKQSGACETWSWHGTERAKYEDQRIEKFCVSMCLSLCKYVYLSVCIWIGLWVCLVSLSVCPFSLRASDFSL